MGILNKHNELKKEYKQKSKEETLYIWWLIFLVGLFVLTVVAIVVSK